MVSTLNVMSSSIDFFFLPVLKPTTTVAHVGPDEQIVTTSPAMLQGSKYILYLEHMLYAKYSSTPLQCYEPMSKRFRSGVKNERITMRVDELL